MPCSMYGLKTFNKLFDCFLIIVRMISEQLLAEIIIK